MTSLASVTLEVTDTTAAEKFYSELGLADRVRLREGGDPASGFRAFTLSLVVPGPATVDGFVGAALDAGATALKPVAGSFWGYGGVFRAPDGAIWKVATSARKDTGPDNRKIDDIVLLLGVASIGASKRFYTGHGLTAARSFPGKYVEFAAAEGAVKLALYPRKALAKDAGVGPEGTGSHRVVLGGGDFTDPDGFRWEA